MGEWFVLIKNGWWSRAHVGNLSSPVHRFPQFTAPIGYQLITIQWEKATNCLDNRQNMCKCCLGGSDGCHHTACHKSIVVVSDGNGIAKYSFDAFSWRALKDPMNCIVNAMSILALVLVRACARLLLIWRGSRGRISRSSNNSLEHSHWLPLLWNLAVDFYPF